MPALKEAEVGAKSADLCRPTASADVLPVECEVRGTGGERGSAAAHRRARNTRLTRLIADLTLDQAPKEFVERTLWRPWCRDRGPERSSPSSHWAKSERVLSSGLGPLDPSLSARRQEWPAQGDGLRPPAGEWRLFGSRRLHICSGGKGCRDLQAYLSL